MRRYSEPIPSPRAQKFPEYPRELTKACWESKISSVNKVVYKNFTRIATVIKTIENEFRILKYNATTDLLDPSHLEFSRCVELSNSSTPSTIKDLNSLIELLNATENDLKRRHFPGVSFQNPDQYIKTIDNTRRVAEHLVNEIIFFLQWMVNIRQEMYPDDTLHLGLDGRIYWKRGRRRQT